MQTNTYNVNKTRALLQTTGNKDEPNIIVKTRKASKHGHMIGQIGGNHNTQMYIIALVYYRSVIAEKKGLILLRTMSVAFPKHVKLINVTRPTDLHELKYC